MEPTTLDYTQSEFVDRAARILRRRGDGLEQVPLDQTH